jgi:spore germination cell wall hydrolase CwlJ-like protein|nr:MAG TPA: Cell Wall Hydrolase [Caudoviricetes sp.]
MKKFISGMLLLSLIFALSGIIMLRTQVPEQQSAPEEATVCVQPSHDVREPVENIVETVEKSLVHSDPLPDKTYTDEELGILALIVYQEAGGDRVSDDTRRLVAQVFLNRVNDSRFPDSFYEVATAERQYGRLYWTGIVWPDRASSQAEAHAVERAYKIAQEVLESDEPVCPAGVIFQAEFVQGEIYAEQDGMYFCFG